ncbi:hypothetical protein GGS20DRAFT_269073 [Poronia punctata]|nr:hypothetical protein GGS20DRAFT_269073 [Poronia punctata]
MTRSARSLPSRDSGRSKDKKNGSREPIILNCPSATIVGVELTTAAATKLSKSVSMEFLGWTFGDRAGKEVDFVPFKSVQKYPHTHANMWIKEAALVQKYFKETLLGGPTWDFFSQLDPAGTREPLLLVPTSQFQQFLEATNRALGTELTIPDISRARYVLSFGSRNTPSPRFLGRVNNVSDLESLKERGSTLLPDDLSGLSIESSQMFREEMNAIYASLTNKDPEKARMKRMERQKGWGRMIKRVQRYLGLRQTISHVSRNASTKTNWRVTQLAPFSTRGTARFVCVDIEAWERDGSLVTEVGLAVLDTGDIEDVPPGKRGKNWCALIKAYHFRIEERLHLVNHRFVQGCPDAFNFGQSQIVSLKHINQAIGSVIGDRKSEDTRPVILVGHDIAQDLKYLNCIGYNHWQVPHITDEIDTKSMFQHMERSPNGRGLGGICSDLGIDGINFHNAGNDAVYTLHAMIAMAIKRTVDGPGRKEEPFTPGYAHSTQVTSF